MACPFGIELMPVQCGCSRICHQIELLKPLIKLLKWQIQPLTSGMGQGAEMP